MYTPGSFQVEDREAIGSFMQKYGFATLVSWDPVPQVTHLPLLVDDVDGQFELTGHMARANPHWEAADGSTVLVIFQGPHAYVSPSWYGEGPAVPTWNYSVVHATGVLNVIHDSRDNEQILRRYVEEFEARHVDAHREPALEVRPWRLESQSDDFVHSLSKAVVSFSVRVETLNAKWKLSQNQEAPRQAGVVGGLQIRDGFQDAELAAMMQASLAAQSES